MSTDNPDKFCNPLEEVEQCAEGLKKWKKEPEKMQLGVKSYKNPVKVGRSYCNGICHRFSTPKPRTGGKTKVKGDPYETHSYCRKCGGVWLPKNVIVNGIRCPCCNIKVANKSRSSKAKGNSKKIYQGLLP